MAWVDADLKIFAAGLAIGGKWNHVNGKENGNSSILCENITIMDDELLVIKALAFSTLIIDEVTILP